MPTDWSSEVSFLVNFINFHKKLVYTTFGLRHTQVKTKIDTPLMLALTLRAHPLDKRTFLSTILTQYVKPCFKNLEFFHPTI